MTELFTDVHPIFLNPLEEIGLNPALYIGDHLVGVASFYNIEPIPDDHFTILVGPYRMASARDDDLPESPIPREVVIEHVKKVSRLADLVEIILRYGGGHIIKTRDPPDTIITITGDLVGLPKLKAVVTGLGYKDRIHYISPLELGIDPGVNDCKKLLEQRGTSS